MSVKVGKSNWTLVRVRFDIFSNKGFQTVQTLISGDLRSEVGVEKSVSATHTDNESSTNKLSELQIDA